MLIVTRYSIATVLFLAFAVSLGSAAESDTAGSRMFLMDTAFKELPQRGPEGEVTLVTEDECELTSELNGTWVLDEVLAAELNPRLVEKRERKPGELGPVTEMTFRVENKESPAIGKLKKWLEGASSREDFKEWGPEFKDTCRRVLAVGTLDPDDINRSFAVVQWRGNLTMLVFRENGSTDTIYLSMACDRKGDDDYLFVREDRGENSPFKRNADEKSD